MLKYTIRFHPDVPGIETAHWQVWRPGMYFQPFRGLKAFATAPTLAEAFKKVEADTVKAMLEFAELTGETNIDLVEAAWWWSAKCRNDWRDRFFNRKPNRTITVAAGENDVPRGHPTVQQ